MLIFKEIQLLPEIFLGISIIYLIIHGTFISVNNKYLLIQNSVLYLSILIITMFCFLLLNNSVECNSFQIFNNTIILDYLSFFSKFWIAIISIFCFLMIQRYLAVQKINYFEYSILILFALLGIFFICSSNDLITAYLSIELQSLSFYVMAAMKKDSAFSVDAGLKYFILGAFSSGVFLFGVSLIYLATGSLSFSEIGQLFAGINVDLFSLIEAGDTHALSYVAAFSMGMLLVMIGLLFKLTAVPFHM